MYRNRICIHFCWVKNIEKADRFKNESIGFKHPYDKYLLRDPVFCGILHLYEIVTGLRQRRPIVDKTKGKRFYDPESTT